MGVPADLLSRCRRDRPVWFETTLEARCENGYRYPYHWASSAPLEVHGRAVEASVVQRRAWSNGELGVLGA